MRDPVPEVSRALPTEPASGSRARTAARPRRPIARLFATRLVLGVVTLWAVTLLVFAATQVLPGDPARAILGRSATPDRIDALRDQLGLDRPVAEQYRAWLFGVVRGDLGVSLATGGPVTDVLRTRLANSALLVALAAAIGIPLALVVGGAAAVRSDSRIDHVLSVITLVLVALPEFVVAMALVFLLATTVVALLPAVSILPPGEPPWRHVDALVLPVATLALATFPYIARMFRASMVEILESEFVQMARLKGLPQRVVIGRHAVRNALVPTIQVAAIQIAWLAGGVVVVEFVFQYPGIGQALVDAVANRDLPLVQAITLIIAAVYVVMNLLADVATILLTPKLRTSLL